MSLEEVSKCLKRWCNFLLFGGLSTVTGGGCDFVTLWAVTGGVFFDTFGHVCGQVY
jgi:hypothetical protein